MRAGLRWTIAVAAAELALGPAPAVAQQSEPATSDAPATETIGPRELQNFNLQGTVTRSAPPATEPAAPSPATSRSARTAQSTSEPARARETSPTPSREVRTADQTTADSAPTVTRPSRERAQTAQSASSISVPLPPARTSLAANAPAEPGFTEQADTAATLAPERHITLWPWLLAALALGAGGAFLFWRNQHSREALAGGPASDVFTAPEPPTARPRPAVPAPAPPSAAPSPGMVSTRLRPWLELSFNPHRCIVEDDTVVFEFDLGLFNSGSAPARDVLIEACMINASPTQEEDLTKFFRNPVGAGDRIATIPPLKAVELKPRVLVTRDQLRVLDAGGRKVFVPLLAFNALYNWGGGKGQTSGSYLLGRDTKGDKLAPFRLDLGPRVFRGIDGRPVPLSVRV